MRLAMHVKSSPSTQKRKRTMRDDFIIELWTRLKDLVPQKDRLDAADSLISICDEYGYADGIELRADLDKELHAAVITYFGEEDLEDLEETEDEYY